MGADLVGQNKTISLSIRAFTGFDSMSGGKFKRGERLGAQSRTPEDKRVEKIQVQGGQTDSNDSPPNKSEK